MAERTVQEIIEGLQKQIDALKGATLVTYPWKAGDKVILPADDDGRRRIIIVPSHELAVANLSLILGVEVYEGEVPACGFIIDKRRHKAFTPAEEPAKDPNAPPADFATNKAPALDEKGQVSAVTAAILGLKKEDFTETTGYPRVAALSKIVGFDVRTEIRDAAWELFQKNNPNWTKEEEAE